MPPKASFSQVLAERFRIPYVRDRTPKVGQAPGDLTYVGEAPSEPVRLQVIDYAADSLDEHQPDSLEEVAAFRDTSTVSWINIDGVHDTELVRQLGERFGIHPLVLEDIVNTGQRPKVESYENYFYVVVKMLSYDEASHSLHNEQMSLVVGPHYVLSFQEQSGDVFDPVRQRIRQRRGRIRHLDPDYLAYALLDIIVDHYFVVLEAFGARTEALEEQILEAPDAKTQQVIGELRRDLILMRRVVWPVRDLFAILDRSEEDLVSETVRPFLRDTYDHVVQIIDILTSLREAVSGLNDLYMSSLSNRMNEIMKVLTIIGTIFIPLTFIAGIYGMNFSYMPELQWRYSYPIALGVMGLLGAALVFYFRRKDWI